MYESNIFENPHHNPKRFPSQVITVRGTSFEPAELSGGSAGSEAFPVSDLPIDMSQFIGQELSKSDRPELTAAKVGWWWSFPVNLMVPAGSS